MTQEIDLIEMKKSSNTEIGLSFIFSSMHHKVKGQQNVHQGNEASKGLSLTQLVLFHAY